MTAWKQHIRPAASWTLGLLLLSHVLSAYASFASWIHWIALPAIAVAVFAISLKRLEVGMLVVLAELATASQGRLFFVDMFGFPLSLRMAVFAAVMAAWGMRVIGKKRRSEALAFRKSRLFWPYAALIAVVILAAIWGLVRGNSPGNVLADANAYAFLLLILPAYEAFASRKAVWRGIAVLASAASFLALEGLVVLYVFSHKFEAFMFFGYRWLRDFRMAEITLMGGDFYRVFFQSQVYLMPMLWIGLAFLLLAAERRMKSAKDGKLRPRNAGLDSLDIGLVAGTGLMASGLILSFSRSFWVGFAASLAAFVPVFFLKKTRAALKVRRPDALRSLVALAAVLVVGCGFIGASLKFPLPPGTAAGPSADFFRSRLTQEDAALRSRWLLLGPLASATAAHPVIGSGFGTLVTFRTLDPRQVEMTGGEVSSFAFEWGYLEMLLKYGMVGVAMYAAIVIMLLRRAWRLVTEAKRSPEERSLVLALALGLIGMLATHAFSPYLNHPLGIGYVIFLTAALDHGLSTRGDPS